jgi:hypothetical protein
MRYSTWIRKGGPVAITPRKKVWGFFYYRSVPLMLREMPVTYWMQLKDVVFEIKYAPYIIGIFLNLNPAKVARMKAGVVVGLYNHVKSQVEKCNRIWLHIHETLLPIDDGIDKMHWEGLQDVQLIYDLAGGDILKAEEIEKQTFATVVNWMRVKLAYIRSEQNQIIKERAKLKK